MLGELSGFERRKQRLRYKLSQRRNVRPRLIVHRTNKHVYAQIIDDEKAIVLTSASTIEKDVRSQLKNGGNVEAAQLIGKRVAEKALQEGVKEVVFDRSGYLYHGRIKALAESARENGLIF